MSLNVNFQIAFTHIRTRKKQTLVAAMGVTIGIALFIFSNSIVVGVSQYSKSSLFKSVPHIRVYNEDRISRPLANEPRQARLPVITNPQFINASRYILNPDQLTDHIQALGFARHIAPNVDVDLFYKSGSTQLKGVASGILTDVSDAMFDIKSTLLAGNLEQLKTDPNSIIIGSGIADKLNVRINDYVNVLSSEGIVKNLRIVGIFSTNLKAVDESKSYINLNTAQQLLKQNKSKITDLYVKINNPDSAQYYTAAIQATTPYKVEDWQTANAEQIAQNKMMSTMTPLISFSILLVAAFGIYNIINMTVSQKMNEIAILKANGFKALDVVSIFVTESFIMGFIGTALGLSIGALLVWGMSQVYVGPPIGYFPVTFDGSLFIKGALFGLLVSMGAGYIPARKAGNVDPVSIFRK